MSTQQKIRANILIPLLISVFVAWSLFTLMVYLTQRSNIFETVQLRTSQTESYFQSRIDDNASRLGAVLSTIDHDPRFLLKFLQRQRDSLYLLGKPLFEQLQSEFNISQLSVIQPSGTCFLRWHDPERYDDSIKRSTFYLSRMTRKQASGIEFSNHMFAVRVIRPFGDPEARVGFIEAGTAIGHLLTELKRGIKSDLAAVVSKSYLGEGQWYNYPVPDGVEPDTLKVFDPVILAHTFDQFPDILGGLSDATWPPRNLKTRVFETGKSKFAAGCIGMVDSDNVFIGHLVLWVDITQAVAEAGRTTARMSIYGGIVSLFLIWILGTVITRVDRRMSESRALVEISTEQLARSEEKYRSIVETTSEIVWEIDGKGIVKFCNPAAVEILGFLLDEIVGRLLFEMMHPDDVSIARKQVERSTRERKGWSNLVIRWVGRDGSIHYLESNAKPVVDTVGEIIGFRGTDREITERFQKEEQIHLLANDLRNTLEATSDAMLMVSYLEAGPTITMANRRFGEIFGVEPTQLIGKLDSELRESIKRYFKDPTAFCAGVERLYAEHETVQSVELELLQPLPLVLERWTGPVRDENGVIIGRVWTYADITLRHESERGRQILQNAVENTVEMVVITDITGRIEYVNPAFERVTGYSRYEAVGENASLLNSGLQKPDFYRTMWETISRGDVWQGKLTNKKKSGELYEEAMTITPVRGDDGVIVNYVGIKKDITEESRWQKQAIESEKMASVGLLAAGVAHEFKNYLCAIIGNASYASENIENHSATAEALEKINRIAANANEIALGLLTFSRQSDTTYEYCHITDIIDSVLAIVRKELEYRGVELVTNYQSIAPIRIVPGKLQQVMLNLIQNSLDAMEDMDGRLEISVNQSEGWLETRIVDNGHGIDSAIIEKIFDPFFSTKGVWGTQTRSGGTGLGLSVCRNIIREHDGELLVESIPGKKTVFIIRLPYLDAPSGQEFPTPKSATDNHAMVYCRDDITFGLLHEHLTTRGWQTHRLRSKTDAQTGPAPDVAFFDTGGPGKIRFAKIHNSLISAYPEVKVYLLSEGQREYLLEEYHKNAAGILSWSSIVAPEESENGPRMLESSSRTTQ
jgi:PAS domain S-box-containing protein